MDADDCGSACQGVRWQQSLLALGATAWRSSPFPALPAFLVFACLHVRATPAPASHTVMVVSSRSYRWNCCCACCSLLSHVHTSSVYPACATATPPCARLAIQANANRPYVCGLREVTTAVRLKHARSVVLAPNIEQVEAQGGLDDKLAALLAM